MKEQKEIKREMYFVRLINEVVPLAIFKDAQEAHDWREENYPIATIDVFELIFV